MANVARRGFAERATTCYGADVPSLLHEGLVELFRSRPMLAADVLSQQLTTPLPQVTQASVVDASLGQMVPTENRSDLVVELQDARGLLVLCVIVEAQLGIDEDKKYTWPLYAAALRARKRCDTVVLVVCTDTMVATWAAAPVSLGPGSGAWTPRVLGPLQLPPIQNASEALAQPELTLLLALSAAHDVKVAGPLVELLPQVIGALDTSLIPGYLALLFQRLAAPLAQRLKELIMANSMLANAKLPDEIQEIFDRLHAEGREEGIEKGREEGIEKGTAPLMRMMERRLKRSLSTPEHALLLSRLDTLGPDRLGDVVLDLSREELERWLADPDAR